MHLPPRYLSLKGEILFLLLVTVMLLLYQSSLRLLFFYYHDSLAADIPANILWQAFATGIRFDAIVTAYAVLPMVFGLLLNRTLRWRNGIRIWLTGCVGFVTFLAVLELDFYREFHQRLNSLVFEYLKEDPETVLSMVWYGFPVVRYLILIVLLTGIFYLVLHRLDQATRWYDQEQIITWRHHLFRLTAFLFLFICVGVQARGTLRQGPPLRWGDAFFSQHTFANHLGLNGAFTLIKAATALLDKQDDNDFWFSSMSTENSSRFIREQWLNPHDVLVDTDTAVLRRLSTPAHRSDQIRNIVIILMESFSAEYTGALGKDVGVTPAFDALAKEGLLFRNFFSNGTHTHQGVFATLACFPNLPGHEYLMYQPEGAHHFSGISRLLADREFNQVFVYNGSFTWDNQIGFFQNQGMTRFIGREDFVNPKFSDPTWGVSDEDMFERALQELDQMPGNQPFFAILQTLSNHMPYGLPEPIPMEPIFIDGKLSERLTAMRYADYALGQFFEQARRSDYFDHTVFVLLGDHGFGVQKQLTDIDLLRFHVPLLLIGPGITKAYGHTMDRVASQVDVVPTVMSLLGQPYQHQCWGRDVLNLPPEDKGVAVIKPSGSDPTVGIVSGDRILVRNPDNRRQLYRYTFGPESTATLISEPETEETLWQLMQGYVSGALVALRENSTAP